MLSLTELSMREFKVKHKIHQQKTQDSITWINLVIKNHYDKCHILLLLNSENLVMLKLHHEYCVFSIKNKKLFIQWVDCFSVKQQVSSLAYELKLSANIKIHLMMSVINLESVSSEKNLYNWLYDDHLLSVKENCNINDEWKSFYIEKLLDCCFCCYKCSNVMKITKKSLYASFSMFISVRRLWNSIMTCRLKIWV